MVGEHRGERYTGHVHGGPVRIWDHVFGFRVIAMGADYARERQYECYGLESWILHCVLVGLGLTDIWQHSSNKCLPLTAECRNSTGRFSLMPSLGF
jgi:hypothetical protein